MAVQKWDISKDICDCLLVSTSNILIQPLLTTVHAFFYVHIHFRTSRIAISLTYLQYVTWVKWNEFSGPHFFLRLFTNTTNCSVSLWMQVSYLFGTCPRICRGNRTTAKILKFDWSMQVTWKWWAIVSQIRLSKRFAFEHICWYSKRKLTNTPAVIFSCYWLGRWFIFTKQIFIVLFWVIIYSYLQKFFKISVLKTLHNSQENTCIGAYF